MFCEQPGEVVKKGKGNCRVYLYNETQAPKRTNESIVAAAIEASETYKRVKGMLGHNVFIYLALVTKSVVDYMHGCLLGVTKKLLRLWFDSQINDKPFFLGSRVKSIDKYLKNVKPPYLIHRLPRRIENNYGLWKAPELRAWLLFYSLPILKAYLPRTYLEHYSC